ncbi:flagellar biosynthetic protein FliR [bacterium]|nr:flagellar biosynthetic protein FliR [candidate division CSSED10-310 bacterium]
MELSKISDYVLGFARILPVTLLSPAFGANLLQGKIRIALAMLLTFCITPCIRRDRIDIDILLECILQVVIGISIGFVSAIPFYAIQSAGEWIDLNRGETLSSILVPTMQTRASSLGRTYLLLSMTLFFSLGIHRYSIIKISETFQIIPLHCLDTMNVQDVKILNDSYFFIEKAAALFRVSVSLALPVVFLLWLTDLVLGFCNRFAPALNVFFIGLPAKLWIGIAMVGLTIIYRLEHISEILTDSLIVPP